MTFLYESHAERRKNIIIYFLYILYTYHGQPIYVIVDSLRVKSHVAHVIVCVWVSFSQEKRRGKMLTLAVGV